MRLHDVVDHPKPNAGALARGAPSPLPTIVSFRQLRDFLLRYFKPPVSHRDIKEVRPVLDFDAAVGRHERVREAIFSSVIKEAIDGLLQQVEVDLDLMTV